MLKIIFKKKNRLPAPEFILLGHLKEAAYSTNPAKLRELYQEM